MPTPTVAGIDVGGKRKGFHAAILRDGALVTMTSCEPAEVASWCREHDASVVAVDAPCGWSIAGGSRVCENTMRLRGKQIQCFRTPSLETATAHTKGFYGWVFNGMEMYQQLRAGPYRIYDGTDRGGHLCFESFPNAITSFLLGAVTPANPKVPTRRRVLHELGYDVSGLKNIDFIDAALCAVAAQAFVEGETTEFGNAAEGFIVVPNSGYRPRA